jgi:hypothetical protein
MDPAETSAASAGMTKFTGDSLTTSPSTTFMDTDVGDQMSQLFEDPDPEPEEQYHHSEGSGGGNGVTESTPPAYMYMGFAGGEGDYEDDEPYVPTGEEVTGRWTREEHDLFLAALKKYGKVCRVE